MYETTLKQLCNAVKCRSVYGAKKPYDQQDEWQRKANSYRVTLSYKGRRYTFDFWQGIGITEEPTAHGCLDCLLSDAQSGEMDFPEFCSEFGYDEDSRRAEKTWKACQKAAPKLRRLLGEDFEMFLYAPRD